MYASDKSSGMFVPMTSDFKFKVGARCKNVVTFQSKILELAEESSGSTDSNMPSLRGIRGLN